MPFSPDDRCILLSASEGVHPRLTQFAKTSDGFRIAELDLQERGMGELVGTRQAGGFQLRWADLTEDADLVELARDKALDLIATDPLLTGRKHLGLRRRIERRYERGMELFRVG